MCIFSAYSGVHHTALVASIVCALAVWQTFEAVWQTFEAIIVNRMAVKHKRFDGYSLEVHNLPED